MRRAIGLGLAGLLAVGVTIAIIASVGGGASPQATPTPRSSGPIAVVRGVIGSEKKPFFDDPQVQAVFRRHGLDVEVDTAGSRQIATSVDLSKYAFAFPAGVPAAEKIKLEHHVSTSYTTFYTPMVIASWAPIAQLLQQSGVATDMGGYDSFDVSAFLKLVARNARWTDLPNNTSYQANKSILITSTDVRTSNSAAMYLAIASYVANGDNVVQNSEQADAIIPKVEPLFSRQGFTEASSEEPFDDYLAIGIGKDPLVMIYESQFLSRVFTNDGSIRPDMVLMYPQPDVLSKHTFIPLTPAGDRVGQLLLHDRTLQQLAARYGFRTSDPTAFNRLVAANHVTIPQTIVDLIEPPTYEALERMITRIESDLA